MAERDGEPVGAEEIEARLGLKIEALASDSRGVARGDVFLAYPGAASDGRRHIREALDAGAAAVLWDPDGFAWDGPQGIPNLPVAGLRGRAGEIAARAFGHPSGRMTVFAVTGTNGKTTVAWLIAGIMARVRGEPAGYFGTVGRGLMGDLGPAPLTTPDAVELQRGLRKVADAGAGVVAIEASSHGLSQHRLAGVECDVGVFTNLSRDHLDHHGSMGEYAAAKDSLFALPGMRGAAVCVDDEHGRGLAGRLDDGMAVATFGSGPARARLLSAEPAPGGMAVCAELDGYGYEWTMPAIGRHNATNALAAMSAARIAGARWVEMLPAMEELGLPPGRMERIGGADARPAVYVDYAHTPAALETALAELRAFRGAGKVWCVFGCGGERDRGKRAQMGRVAAQGADRVVVTTDNPRGESPSEIIAEIVSGAGGRARVIEDRAQAIFAAVREAAAEDAVLIAGKGHEKTQCVGGEILAFDDVQAASAALGET